MLRRKETSLASRARNLLSIKEGKRKFLYCLLPSYCHSPIPILNLVLSVPCHMDLNQFNWQAYINLLQNYQQPPSNENSQHPPSLFPLLPLPPPSMSENSQIPPHFIPYLPLPPPPVTYNQSPSTENSQRSQTFLQCHKTPLSHFISLPIVIFVHKLLQMRKLILQ